MARFPPVLDYPELRRNLYKMAVEVAAHRRS